MVFGHFGQPCKYYDFKCWEHVRFFNKIDLILGYRIEEEWPCVVSDQVLALYLSPANTDISYTPSLSIFMLARYLYFLPTRKLYLCERISPNYCLG